MDFIAVFIVAFGMGYWEQRTQKRLNELYKNRKPEPELGATQGAYKRANEYAANQDGEVGISEPKTPQLLEWEARIELEEEQHHVNVKPRK